MDYISLPLSDQFQLDKVSNRFSTVNLSTQSMTELYLVLLQYLIPEDFHHFGSCTVTDLQTSPQASSDKMPRNPRRSPASPSGDPRVQFDPIVRIRLRFSSGPDTRVTEKDISHARFSPRGPDPRTVLSSPSVAFPADPRLRLQSFRIPVFHLP